MKEEKELFDYIYNNFKSRIESWDNNIKDDIYVISFYVYDEDDDPRKPTITLGYNTISNFKKSINNTSDVMEAKWNYAFWLQNQELVIGIEPKEKKLIELYIKKLSLFFSDEESEDDFEKCLEQGEKITKYIISLLIEVSKKLHKSKTIQNNFKSKIPIIIHELEYYDEIYKQNEKANPKDYTKEFKEWILSM